MHRSISRLTATGLGLAAVAALSGPAWAHGVATERPTVVAQGDDLGLKRAAAETETTHLGTLQPGDELFWDGEYVEDSINPPFTVDACGVNPLMSCFDYTFEVAEGGDRLRVAISDPSAIDVYELFLFDPSEAEVGRGSTWFSYELFAADPAPGLWRVRVIAAVVEDAPFRMRAKLEAPEEATEPKGPPRDVLPNLRSTPAFDFTFSAPPGHTQTIGTGFGEMRSADSCSPGERAHTVVAGENQPERCLRFSTGPQNIGEGLLDLVYTPGGPTSPSSVDQIIYRTEGPPRTRSAGEAALHTSHGHYHVGAILQMEMFRVTDDKHGRLEHVASAPKLGFCLQHFIIPEWFEFNSEPVTHLSTCEIPGFDTPTQPSHMYMEPGWGDIYNWATDFNFIDHGAAGDGLYVIRTTSDPEDRVLESNEKDNVSYSLVSIEVDSIEVLERGYGDDPWDHQKSIDTDWAFLSGAADVNPVPFVDPK